MAEGELSPIIVPATEIAEAAAAIMNNWLNSCVHVAVSRAGGASPVSVLQGHWEGLLTVAVGCLEMAAREPELAEWMREALQEGVPEEYRREQALRFASTFAPLRARG